MKKIYSLIFVTFLFIITPDLLFAQPLSWEQTNGPIGGEVLSFAFNQQGDVFVGSPALGVLRSTANGSRWKYINKGMGELWIYHLVVTPNGTLFAAASNSDSIYRSTDNGNNWEPVFVEQTKVQSTSLICNSQGHVFSIYAGRIYSSIDNGDTWNNISIKFSNALLYDIIHGYLQNMYAVSYAGSFFKSSDDGKSWTEVNKYLSNFEIKKIIAIDNHTIIMATTNNGLLRSIDDGISWTTLRNGLPNSPVFNLAYHPGGVLFAYLNNYSVNQGLYKSFDGGNSWTAININQYLSSDNTITSLGISPTGDVYISIKDYGIFKSNDLGVTWSQLNYIGSTISSIVLDRNGYLFTSYAGKVYRSTNRGDSWQIFHPINLPTSVINIYSDASYNLYAIHSQWKISSSTDAGNTWREVTTESLPSMPIDLVVTSQGDLFIAARGDGIYRTSIAGGASVKTNFPYDIINTMKIDLSGNIFVGTNGIGLYRSSDNGQTWQALTKGITGSIVRAIGIFSSGDIYASTFSEGLYYSNDHGDSWKLLTNAIKNAGDIFEDSHRNIFTFLWGKGLYYSSNKGMTWQTCSQGLPGLTVSCLVIDLSDQMYLGLWGAGIFRSTQSPLFSEHLKSVDEKNIILSQNYPNPFTTSTAIGYGLSASGFVRLEVFDMLGRKVATLVDEEKEMGEYTSLFKVRDSKSEIRSGIYFYRLTIGNNIQTKKMIVMQ